jgi:hypothetical protein
LYTYRLYVHVHDPQLTALSFRLEEALSYCCDLGSHP